MLYFIHAIIVITIVISFTFFQFLLCLMPSLLWPCWLGIRKSIRPVKWLEWGVHANDLHIVHHLLLR